MTLYLGIEIESDADELDLAIAIEGHPDLDKYGFSPIHSSTQAVARDVDMPSPGESTSMSQQGINISPYHITKPHNWSSRYFENQLYKFAHKPMDFVIVNAVEHNDGLAPIFIKYIKGASLASLTRDIDSSGKMSESLSFTFQSMEHIYFEINEKGEHAKLETFSYDLNTQVVGSSPEPITKSEYGVPKKT